MGYSLEIGQLKTFADEEGNYVNDVERVIMDDAPAYGEPTDHSNARWPSYTTWRDAMRFVGLEDLMFNKVTGLISSHPGCVPLVEEHKKVIDTAYKKFYEKYSYAKAGYSPKINEKANVWKDPDWPVENDWATRLEWLKYWVDWALKNCDNPVFLNT